MKILVINSCGKKKLGSHDLQPTCKDLDTKDKRDKILEKYADISYSAGELYTGNQAKTVRKAIKILRTVHEVDLFIISAGFGIVAENDKLPPYECSFNKMGEIKIREMAQSFAISDKLESFTDDYDLIYLVLGKNYLHTIDLNVLAYKGKEIVVFSDIDYAGNFITINNQQLIKMNEIDFAFPLGNNLMNKASLLLNYADTVVNENMLFSKWLSNFSQIYNNISTSSFTFNEVSVGNIKKDVSVSPINNMSAEVVRPCSNCIDKIKNEIELLSENDLKTLANVCKGLRAISNKNGEKRKDYYEKYHDKIDDMVYFINIIEDLKNDLIENHAGDTNEPKKLLVTEIIAQIRDAQEFIGIEQYLLNQVKMSIMKTLISWHNNPELLKIQTVYKPKSAKIKKSKILVPQLSISCKSNGPDDYGYKYLFEISNSSNYPVQNIMIEFESDGVSLDIINAKGRYVNFHSKSIMIEFIKAPMSINKNAVLKFQVTLESFDEIKSIDVKMKYDNPFAKNEAVINSTIHVE